MFNIEQIEFSLVACHALELTESIWMACAHIARARASALSNKFPFGMENRPAAQWISHNIWVVVYTCHNHKSCRMIRFQASNYGVVRAFCAHSLLQLHGLWREVGRQTKWGEQWEWKMENRAAEMQQTKGQIWQKIWCNSMHGYLMHKHVFQRIFKWYVILPDTHKHARRTCIQ